MLDELFSGQMLLFSVPAVVGTLFFAFRLVLMFTGIPGLDIDADHTGDLSGDAHHSSELFKVLSIQGIAAFLMGFGWGGIGGLRGAGWEFSSALLSGAIGGVVMVWLLSWLLKLVHDMQSSGNVPIQAALDAEGDVYVTIPPRGKGFGQVRVIIGQRQRIYNAVSDDTELHTNARVRVVRVNHDNSLTVAALAPAI